MPSRLIAPYTTDGLPDVQLFPLDPTGAIHAITNAPPTPGTIRKYPTAINGAGTYGAIDILVDDYFGHTCNVDSISLDLSRP